MAPLDQLRPPTKTPLRAVILYTLRGYLVVAVVLITVKVVTAVIG